MSTAPQNLHDDEETHSSEQLVHKTMHFLAAVRYRKGVVLGALAVSLLLAGLYYATATRYYGASATLLVMQAGLEKLSTSMADNAVQQQGLMPTFEKLIRSAKVIEGAIQRLPPEHRIDFADLREAQWVAAVQKNLSSKALRQTNILEVTYCSRDPDTAVFVLNAILQSYVDFIEATHKTNAGEIIRVLTREQTDLGVRLAAKEQELLMARTQYGDLGIRTGSRVVHPVVQRAIALSEKLVDVQKNRIETEASLAAIQAAVRNGDDLRQYLVNVADSVGREVLLNSLGMNSQAGWVQAYLERDLLDARASLKTLEGYLGPAHPDYINKLEKVRASEQYLNNERGRVTERNIEMQCRQLGPLLIQMVYQKLVELQTLEASLQARCEQAFNDAVALNGQVSQIEILEHDLQWLRNLHDVLLNQIASVDLKQDSRDIRATVVSEPKPVYRPVSPDPYWVLLGALVVGLGGGMMSVYVLDVLDDRFRSLEELQSQVGAPVLALVRQLQVEETIGIQALQMYAAPGAAEAEAFRTLRTALALVDTQPRRIVFTSAEPGDGKTTVLANLGVCLAQAGKKTLLIDADLRRPGLTAMLGMRGPEGLASVICAPQGVLEAALRAVRPSGVEGLDVLPSGMRSLNPAELLASSRFSELLAWAETVYDQILIDSPPILATSDAALLGRQVDGMVLIIQADKNRRRGLLRVAERLAMLHIPLLGMVLNRVGSESDKGYYGYNGYGYGYGYGYGDSYGYSSDSSEEDDAERGIRPHGTTPTKHESSAWNGDDDEQGPLIVPRRVA